MQGAVAKERFLAEGQSLVEENIPANTHYRKEPFVGNVVLCIAEPCGCVNRLEFGTKYCKHSPSLKEPILHQAILNCIQSVFHNKEEIAEAVREAQKKIILFEDAKNNPEVICQRIQDIDHGMANLLTLAAQSSQTELFEKKFKEMTEEKARLAEQLKQAEENATTDAKRQKQLDDILKAIDIDIVELTEFDDTFIRRIVEQVTILSKDKIEVRFIGGFSKVGDIPTK